MKTMNTVNDPNGQYENLETMNDTQPSFMHATVQGSNNLQLMSNNDALNDSKSTNLNKSTNAHRRIPSYIPKANTNNSNSGKDKDDKDGGLNKSIQEEKRQEAYKLIQQKIAS